MININKINLRIWFWLPGTEVADLFLSHKEKNSLIFKILSKNIYISHPTKIKKAEFNVSFKEKAPFNL